MSTRVEDMFRGYKIQLEAGMFAGSHEIFTPLELVNEMIEQIPSLPNKNSILVLFNLEFAISLVYNYNIPASRIHIYVDNLAKDVVAHKIGLNVIKDLGDINMKFDVVLGNPPYQGKEGNSTNSIDLAAEFVYKSVELSNNIVSLVIPSAWTGPSPSKLKKFLYDAKLNNLVFHGDKWFNVNMRTCHFLLTKNDNDDCKVTDINHNTELFNLTDSMILSENNTQTKFITKFDTTKNLGTRWLRGKLNLNKVNEQTTGDVFITGVGKQGEKYNTSIITVGNEITGKGLFKVVLPNMGAFNNIGAVKVADVNHVGGYSVVFLTTSSEIESINLKQYLETNTIKTLIKSVKTNTPNSKSLFEQIPDIDLTKSWTDEELYQHFNLTQKEIDYIESTVK